MQFCAHLGYQFTEFSGLDRLEQAANAGFKAVEWPAIYNFDIIDLAKRSNALGLNWVQVTLPTGDAAKGEKGLTSLKARRDDFLRSLDVAVEYAKALGATMIHPMAGVGASLSDPESMEVYLRNLESAQAVASENGLKVIVEVISQATVPGYAMCTYELAAQVCEKLPEVNLLLDAFHAQTLTGNPAKLVSEWAGRIGHIQIADSPGRHEPGTGSINFESFFNSLKTAGYDGWVGCEYNPKGTTHEGLSRLDALRPFL